MSVQYTVDLSNKSHTTRAALEQVGFDEEKPKTGKIDPHEMSRDDDYQDYQDY